MRKLASTLLLAFITSHANAGPTKFDLICKGKTESIDEDPPKIDYSISHEHYRIDLIRNLFCSDNCLRPRVFVSKNEASLVLVDDQSGITRIHSEINRTTGTLSSSISMYEDGKSKAYAHIYDDEKCSVSSFSGIPQARF